jgi:hypothetical protein
MHDERGPFVIPQLGFGHREWLEGGRSLRHQAAGLPERMLALYPTPPQELAQVKAFLDDLATQLE